MTLVYDCETNATLPLNRSSPSELDTNGVIFLGRRLLENDVFEVSFYLIGHVYDVFHHKICRS